MARRCHRFALATAGVLAALLLSPASAPGQVLEPGGPAHLLPDEPAPAAATDASGRRLWQVQRIDIAERPAHIIVTAPAATLKTVRVESQSGAWYVLDDCAAGLCGKLVTVPHGGEGLPTDALPGSHVALGSGRIARVWLADPTKRIEDSPIGPWVAGTLVLEDNTTEQYRLELPLNQAFEDLRPRIADIEGNGEQTVFVVRSGIEEGAALIALRLEGEGLLRIAAETPPAGRPQGWLNPVGIADFTGDGRKLVAAVASPDLGGELQLWDFTGHAFKRRFSVPGVSNHLPGSAIVDMAVVGDFEANQSASIALPDAARKVIRILSFWHGEVAEPADVRLPAPVVTEIVGIAGALGARPMLLMGLEDGELVLLH